MYEKLAWKNASSVENSGLTWEKFVIVFLEMSTKLFIVT